MHTHSKKHDETQGIKKFKEQCRESERKEPAIDSECKETYRKSMRFGLPRNSRRIQRLGSQSNSTTTEEIRIATTHNDKTRHSELIKNKETCRVYATDSNVARAVAEKHEPW